MRRFLKLIVAIFLLAGCSSITAEKPVPTIAIEPIWLSTQLIVPTSIDTIIPTKLAKIKKIDWLTAIIPLVNQLVQAPGIELGKVIIINLTKNNTNMSIQSAEVTNAIANAVNNQNLFKFIPQDVVASARKTLGLYQDDSLVTRSKAIGLARYIQADYMLYSVVSGNQQQSKIEMQLMEVQTGEILWSGINFIK